MSKVSRLTKLVSTAFLALFLTACYVAPQVATPDQLAQVAPAPIEGNTGKYMSPYTSDGVLAEWVDKAINAKMGAAVGSAVGAYAGQKALENIPFVGGFLGEKAGNAAGRAIALEASGGLEFITASSDLSFDKIEDLAVYLYATYGMTEHFQDALEATWEIYPELKTGYYPAINRASQAVQPQL